MTDCDDVKKWMRRLNRAGPFYLAETITGEIGNRYIVIWNHPTYYKTKVGYLEDGMLCRYGIQTMSVLNGDRPHDLWNGSAVDDDLFAKMLDVRNEVSTLPIFELSTLKDLRH